ncbi:MAG: Gfo/Idh/MocA family oxidoreductase [Cyclobacteriaceae bacterium]
MSGIEGKVKWGIIGCGDVCEVKSGPAFNKVTNSELVAVMRRNAEKAEDYATRHHVHKFYTDAEDLINDPNINAIYIATPPSSHEEYAIKSILAGKPVYIEKPLTTDAVSSERILQMAKEKGVKVTGAYYRRRLPLFEKAKSIVDEGVLGNILQVNIKLLLPPTHNGIAQTDINWRIDPSVSGGGLFHDLAPHMLDIIYWIFGEPLTYEGQSINQSNAYSAPDYTVLNATFASKVAMNACWAFNVNELSREDTCQIIGTKGHLTFPFFASSTLKINTENFSEELTFQNPENIQHNMIRDTVKYFRGEGENPCSISDALVSMKMIDAAS